jgi:23S rRNA pseudouridine1911/1915/1917 synthase
MSRLELYRRVADDRAAMSRWIVAAADAGVRLDTFLAAPERAGSRGRAADALRRGKIFLNDREATVRDAGATLATGDVVRLWMDRPGTASARLSLGDARDLPIVYEDDHLIVLNKPAGVLAVPLQRREDARSVYRDLKAHLARRGRRPYVVHRIDRDTSGLVVFAANTRACDRLKDQFERRTVERVYLAVVYGRPSPASGTWRDRIAWHAGELIQKQADSRDPRAKDAISRYTVIEKLARASLLEVRLVTGRRNQIRIQGRLHGHPLVGERQYVHGPDDARPIAFPRQALHAHRLVFSHPVDGRTLRFEAALPPDLEQLIARLRG